MELSTVVEFYLVETSFIFGINIGPSCCCSDNPGFSLVYKLPILLYTKTARITRGQLYSHL